MVKYTKEELIRIIKDYSKFLGRTPKMKEVAHNKNLPSINQFLKLFRTWNDLLKEGDLKLNSISYYSRGHLLNVLKLLSKNLGKTPTIEDLKNNKDSPSPKVYFEKFGSWNNALKLVGLKINVRKDYTKKELIELLNKKAKDLKRSPMIKDLESDKNMPGRDTYEGHFGTFNKALKSAGLEVRYVFRKWAKNKLIEKLREKTKELGRCPTQRDIDKDPSMPGKGNYREYFGSFNNAVRKAGLNVNYNRNKKELIEILQKLYLKLNRTPTREELKKDGDCPSLTPFVEKFGSYTAACLRAGLVPNDGRNNKIWRNWENIVFKWQK